MRAVALCGIVLAAAAAPSLSGGVRPSARPTARWSAGMVVWSGLGRSTLAAPPHPAPVSRAPRAPARVAAPTTGSSSGALHAYNRRHDSWDS